MTEDIPKNRTKSACVIYTSMTLRDEQGTRLGIRQALEACLP
jgi:hypothetical protein